ncbi:hypothetical protein BDZ91DRAFT_725339 [Kalaharituber pfeilii]|nr:hypothetical protein BDZ91DRAFT_725339 [Kalaharituber pfeilii]
MAQKQAIDRSKAQIEVKRLALWVMSVYGVLWYDMMLCYGVFGCSGSDEGDVGVHRLLSVTEFSEVLRGMELLCGWIRRRREYEIAFWN